MAKETQALSTPAITAIVFNNSDTSSFSQFTAEEVVKPSRGDGQQAITFIQSWEAAERKAQEDNRHMPPLSQVLHNSLVVTKGYEANVIQKVSQFPDYPNNHLETRITSEYVAVTSVISEADSQRLLAAPKPISTGVELVPVQGPIKLWAEPKQAVHTIGFSLEGPKMLEEVNDSPADLSNEWFEQQLKPAA